MTTLIFGIGVGLFLILSLWALAILIFLISLKIEKKIGLAAVLTIGLFTIALFNIPRAPDNPTLNNKKPYDQLFIWRVLLLILLLISSTVGFLEYIKLKLLESVRPVKISNWVF